MPEGYDFRDNNVAPKAQESLRIGKRTNNSFRKSALPSDEEMYDDEERAEIEKARKEQIAAEQEAEAKEERVIDDEGKLLEQMAAEGEKNPNGVYHRNMMSLISNYKYEDVPRMPDEYSGANIIGLRTRPTGNSSVQIGAIAPKKKLRIIWENMTDVEKYITMLISDHRHLTVDQLDTFVVLPTRIRHLPKGGHNSIKPYYEFLTREKYGVELDYKDTFKTGTVNGLEQKLGHLVDLGVIEEITPSYKVHKNDDRQFNETPSLFTSHYYLTAVGARLLISQTLAEKPGNKKNMHEVGFVPTYRSAAYLSIVHETECADVFTSMARNAMFLSNIDALGGREEGDETDYGWIDVCRFYHEKDVEEKHVPYRDTKTNKKMTIDFKPDGKMTIFSSLLDEFVDYYLEYDSGSSTSAKIKHKVEAFTRYNLWQMRKNGDRFRRPMLLLVSQNPSSYMPGLKDDKPTRYTRGIQQMTQSCFPDHKDDINDISTVLEGDCRMIRMHGALGPCWHRLDLTTGIPEEMAYDLIASSRYVTDERK